MSDPDPTAQDIALVEALRERADRAYNDALTALDAAVLRVPELPPVAEGYDEHQLTPLNEAWRIRPDETQGRPGGWRHRIAALLWRLAGPTMDRQQAFNAALVDHLNRNVEFHRAQARTLSASTDVLRDQLGALAAFETRLMVYLQQISPFVQTNLDERVQVAFERGVAGAVDDLLKRIESMTARERRYEARAAQLGASHAQLQSSLATLQQATQAVKRELERVLAQTSAAGRASAAGAPAPAPDAAAPAPDAAVPRQAAAAPAEVNAYKYVGFEDRFRGSPDDIRSRLAEYLPFFEGARDVVDIGCGRGEFLELLRERGIGGRGLDLNHEMVEVCQTKGLQADEGDALAFLRSLDDGSIGGLLAAQVVEHLQPDYLLSLLDVAYHKLWPGSTIVLETINPACWFAFFESYIRDVTHVRPLHPDTLSYFLTASGFQQVTVRFRAPYPEHEKLQTVPSVDELSETFNANVERVNRLLFTYLDYAAVGRRL